MRPTRDEMLMEIAEVVARRSTCSRAHVGVVIARDARPLVTGYNGAPAGMPHCNHSCNCEGLHGNHWPNCEFLKPCNISVHAEVNALAFAARYGVRTNGAELHTTMCPCYKCAQLIINAGIDRVVADQAYRDRSGLDLLQNAGIDIQVNSMVR